MQRNLLKPPPSPTNSNKKKLYDIKTVDIALAVRSKIRFIMKTKTIFALTDSSRDLTRFNGSIFKRDFNGNGLCQKCRIRMKIE